ncbi:MAG: hypothetical protein SVU88_03950 [Candidatus Nanohaloarchaea archaeon]|nr:hypothetical protein [Candidatus Nanohaloarchaea archaeon]
MRRLLQQGILVLIFLVIGVFLAFLVPEYGLLVGGAVLVAAVLFLITYRWGIPH